MTFPQALEAIEKEFELAQLEDPAGGPASLWVADRYLIELLPQGKEHLLLRSSIIALESNDAWAEDEWRHILRLSRAFIKLTPDILSFDEAHRTLCLSHVIELGPTNIQDLRHTLEAFLNNLEFWTKTTEKRSDTDPSATEAPTYFIP